MNEAPQIPAGVDTGRPTPARIYDYMLQGNNYFQVDRFAAEQILKAAPEIRDADSDGSRWLYCGVARKP